MMNNKADTIEEYILKQLMQNDDKQIELNRTALADEISCAPSQISYVLSTRFTMARGFMVESRRGLGGYIKIAVVPEEIDQRQLIYRDMLDEISKKTPFSEMKSMVNFLLDNKLITRREAELVIQMTANLYKSEASDEISADERARLVRSIFVTLAKIT